ncbi:hypothetical protein EDD28_2739 [Salana multivorans]|uniref:DUF732 domain-containing protein n=1 Tax=Salana multivorans TaxID=120377 RepID=A0A3N2D0N3_9MICO|nr:hypothetical protein [Salana multivorans]ROR93327.1 hypothetical protein EDD28_2739 [Salana multivorans]
MTRTTTRTLLALPLLAALGLAACGSNGSGGSASGRPSAGEIAKVLTAGSDVTNGSTMDQEMADCYAGILADSKLSDETLRALVDGDENYTPADEEAEGNALVEAFTQAAADCGTPS